MFFSGYTKVLVGIGYAPNGGTTNNFEIIDLQTPSSKCNNVPGYSHSVYGSMAILGIDENDMIKKSLTFIEKYWFPHNHDYIFGDKMTIADLSLACELATLY